MIAQWFKHYTTAVNYLNYREVIFGLSFHENLDFFEYNASLAITGVARGT